MGMHRSGTSALAGALSAAGFHAGEESSLLQADQYNKQGYFEQVEAVSINDSILFNNLSDKRQETKEYVTNVTDEIIKKLGWLLGAWIDFKNISSSNDIEGKIQLFLSKIQQSCPENKHIVIKDPRISLTFPVWQKWLKSPVVIVLYRNPYSVMQSLWNRDRFYPSLSYSIWYKYYYAIACNTKNIPTCYINYDQLINTTTESLDNLFSWLNKQDIKLNSQNMIKASSMINTELRHNKNDSVGELPLHIEQLYEKFLKLEQICNTDKIFQLDIPDISPPWHQALYVITRESYKKENQELTIRLTMEKEQVELKMKRLINHPVSGRVIRWLAYLKRDNSFGRLYD